MELTKQKTLKRPSGPKGEKLETLKKRKLQLMYMDTRNMTTLPLVNIFKECFFLLLLYNFILITQLSVERPCSYS